MANTKRLTSGLSDEVRATLTIIGANIRLARKRRKLSVATLAERVFVSSPTIQKLERGDPTVSLGVLVTTLWILRLDGELKRLAAPELDAVGLQEEIRRLGPKRRRARDDLDF